MISLKTKDWQIDNVETVLFDKDGTFIDLHFFWGQMTELRAKETIKYFNINDNHLKKLCEILGYDTEKKLMKKNRITALYSRVKIIKIYTEKLNELGVNTNITEIEKIFDYVNDIFYKNMHDYTKPIDEAINFIKLINKKELKIGIVTSDSVISTKKTLKYFDWENLFSCIIGRESSQYTKESGELTKLALKELNANPKTTIMIGDAPMDYISAQNAGIEKTILVATGQLSKEDLLVTSAYVVSSLNEIVVKN